MSDTITQSILAEVVGIAADAIICINENQVITFFNSGAEGVFGWTSAEILGKRIEVLIPERYRAHHEEQVHGFGQSKVRARRMGERSEIAAVKKSGEEFPAEAAISQIHQGEVVVYAVVLRDVSHRKRFEQRQSFLAQAGERLASAFGSEETLTQVVTLAVPTLADGCFLEEYSADGFHTVAVAHFDKAVESVLGKVRAIGPRAPLPEDPLSLILQNRRPVLISEDASGRVAAASGSQIHIDAVTAMGARAALFLPMMARGKLIGALCLFRSSRGFDLDEAVFAEDLSRLAALALDNARLHETLRRNLRWRDEMIGIVSHDLRNPVAAVKMLTQAMINSADKPSSDLQNIFLMAQAADQMDALIRDLLDVSRLESGNLRIAPEAVHPRDLVTESLKTLVPLADEKGISIGSDVAAELRPVYADPERIQQTMSNLVGNAIKFTKKGGSIAVTAREDAGTVIFSVSDSGVGIPTLQLPYVFERYWQSARTEKHGAGLGLAIAKGIVEAHGGSIWIESEPDKGTTVLFSLPIDGAVGASSK